jgi:hypothetical protein
MNIMFMSSRVDFLNNKTEISLHKLISKLIALHVK